MSDEPLESNEDEVKIHSDDDWENRILCSDESCIGVIGPDGRCKECGKPYKEPQTPEFQTPEPQTTAKESGAEDDIDRGKHPAKQDDWENRILCSDESCIGIIGPDGRCKECGKVHQG
jgi:hypothetical protein